MKTRGTCIDEMLRMHRAWNDLRDSEILESCLKSLPDYEVFMMAQNKPYCINVLEEPMEESRFGVYEYVVVDSDYNRQWFGNLIGRSYPDKPKYIETEEQEIRSGQAA